MATRMNRRNFLAAAAAFTAGSTAASAQDGIEAPLIIRKEIYGVDPRYAAYASVGPYLHSSSPISYSRANGDVVLFAPKAVKAARLVVFSHGALADPLTYRDLIWHWTSHGFVVAAPLHSDAVIEAGPTLRKTKAGAVSEWPISALLEDPKAWRARLEACMSCLDETDKITAVTGIEILPDRPVIAGHGYGAYVAQLLLGATVVGSDGGRLTFADRRFFAGIVMSPQGPGVMGLDDASWSDVQIPVLYLLAENDADFTGQPAMEKAKSYLLAKPGYKHMGFLKRGSANTFSGHLARTSESEYKLFEVVRSMSTAFLLSYANYDPAAFEDMKTDFFERMSLGAVDEGRR